MIENPPGLRRVFLCPKFRKEHDMEGEKLYIIEEKTIMYNKLRKLEKAL